MTELERKITLDFIHGNDTIADYIDSRTFVSAVYAIPESVTESVSAEPVRIGDRIAMRMWNDSYAEISAEKEIRAEKFRKTHDLCKKSKDDTPADRKRNKIRRLRKMYGDVFEDGREWYYENGKTGSKKSTEKDAEIFRNLRERSMENDARMDYITETVEHYVGKTTLQKQIDRKYAEMQKIKTEFCEKNACHSAGDDYAVTDRFAFVVFYPDEFYQKKWELQELELKQKKAYQRKLDKGNKYLRKFVEEE